jgi:hypothetical protein
MAVLRDMAVEQGYVPQDMNDRIKKVDVLAQKLRHGITDYLLSSIAGDDTGAAKKELSKELAGGLEELE